MQRLLLIAGSALALTACSSMEGMTKHHTPYAKLGQIAKEQDAQQALLLTREGNLVVVNVSTGEIIKPSREENTLTTNGNSDAPHGHAQDNVATTKVSDEEFAEIKRKFDHTITIKAVKGSVCLVDVINPPGDVFKMCHPHDPKWW